VSQVATASNSGAGELAGYVWQPRGAGNSVAICGLAGALTVALLAGARAPRLAPVVLVYWCGALLAARWGRACCWGAWPVASWSSWRWAGRAR
jgi:hypothetical protein